MTDLTRPGITNLASRLPGLVSTPDDDRYMAATAIWARPCGAMPRAIVHCRTSADVQTAIGVAHEHDIPLSVRGGGHDWAGRALCDGVVLDLSGMRSVTLDADHRVATVAGGARAGDVTAVTDRHGVAVAAGSVTSVGMTGLTLGGGYGPLVGRFGLALDNLLTVEIVLADGRLVTASPDEHPELFWALRGGGGNFGVVTAMQLRAHELPCVLSGLLMYPFAEAKSVLENCAAIAAAMPDEFSMQVGVASGPDGQPAVMIAPTWSGVSNEGERRLAPLLKLGRLLHGNVERKSCGALLATFDPMLTDGLRVVIDTCWLPVLDCDNIETLIEAMKGPVSPGCAILTHDFKGAATRVAAEATAFGLRRQHELVEVMAMFPHQSEAPQDEAHHTWVRSTRLAFANALPGGYPNLLGPNEYDRAAKSYGGNAEKLARIKREYDPENVFFSAIPLPDERRSAR